MRPVRLDLAGFASFRQPATVDFDDVDYFALVGPTGSGKSTVIDAMVFGLYGSAPRWGRKNAIADALAPTSTSARVRLVFDIGATRYAIAREVRRSGQSITQRNVVLERFEQPGADPDTDAPAEVLAGDPKGATDAITSLLGLGFDDFCQCVVLPQGQFSDFLRAKPSERQEILLKLLGAGQYEKVRQAAATKASGAAERATVLTTQLGDLADATADAEHRARDRADDLARLVEDVAAAVAALDAAMSDAVRLQAELDSATFHRDQLAGVTVPTDVPDLQANVDAAATKHRDANAAETAAAAADTAARAARADGPDRAAVMRWLDDHEGKQRLAKAVPGAATDAEQAAAAEGELAVHVGDADAQEEAARAAAANTRADYQASTRELTGLISRRDQLAAVSIPATVPDLGARTAAAAAHRRTAEEAVTQAHYRVDAARKNVAEAGDKTDLQRSLDLLDEIAGLTEALGEREQQQRQAQQAVTAAEAGLEAASATAYQARAAVEQASQDATAATMRTQLVEGEPCPVCTQQVAVLPLVEPVTDLDDAKAALAAAEDVLAVARTGHQGAFLAEAKVAAAMAETRARLEQRRSLLGDSAPTRDDVTRQLAALAHLTAAAAAADEALGRARRDALAAAARVDELAAETARARSQLRAVHGPLVALGAPDVDDTDLPAAWQALTAWATHGGRQLGDVTIPAATTAADVARESLEKAEKALRGATARLRDLRARHTAAVKAAGQAATTHRSLQQALNDVTGRLAVAPTADAAREMLAECDRLDQAAADADQALRSAREHRQYAEGELALWTDKVGAARSELRLARDALVPLGAPALDDTHLTSAWRQLARWAARAGQEKSRTVQQLTAEVDTAVARVDRLRTELTVCVTDFRVDVPAAATGAQISQLVAVAADRAHAHADDIAGKRRRAQALRKQVDAAHEESQVARMLADLMQSPKFPRWLASAALDTLVADASASLLALSGGQFDLTHDKGDFYVVDHHDADSRRSVRTLSGGETFQASLALALALSAQMSTLATGEAAKLDSLFLDEGFGTLDADTLEVVAGTLENLAHGERMVGIVTHVAALADRVPVRYVVARDGRTSTIQRETA